MEGKLCSDGHNCRRQNKFNLSFSFPKIVVSEERARKNRYSLEIQRQILKILLSLGILSAGECDEFWFMPTFEDNMMQAR